MASILNKTSQNFYYVFGELYDERTKDTGPSIEVLITLLVSYVYISKRVGPAWMKDRKPFDLTTVIFFYNIFQIVASFYIFYEGLSIWWNHYNFSCQPVLQGSTPLTRKIIDLVWMYLHLKLFEFVETIIFVLRKKTRQVSNLHVYHHFLAPVFSFIGLKYYPTGHSSLLGVINSFVHTIMYIYYLIAGLGPQYQKYLWWKKHVTIIQLIQFVLVLIHNIIPLLNGCNYPKWANVAISLGCIHFLYLFGKFYYKNYVANQKTDGGNKKYE